MKHIVVAGMIGLTAFAGLSQSAAAMPLSALFNRVFHGENASPEKMPLHTVQSNEIGRIGQLEEQIRQLNGRIEEMSYQLLQMQEQIRKFQEDNEYRFQDLESGGSGGTQKKSQLDTPRTNDQASANVPPAAGNQAATDPNAGLGSDIGGNGNIGAPPTTLGQIEFDQNGNPVGVSRDTSSLEQTLPGTDQGLNQTPETQQQTAGLDNPGDLYQSAYGHVLTGDYSKAENEFRDYLDVFPKGEKAADASFWMGEAQYSQGKYNDAAKTFLNAHQTYSKSPKAPEMLLKLGMSLAALDNKDTACATLREVNKRYPSASPAVKSKVGSEQSRLAC